LISRLAFVKKVSPMALNLVDSDEPIQFHLIILGLVIFCNIPPSLNRIFTSFAHNPPKTDWPAQSFQSRSLHVDVRAKIVSDFSFRVQNLFQVN